MFMKASNDEESIMNAILQCNSEDKELESRETTGV
jgi:hypothetical protein